MKLNFIIVWCACVGLPAVARAEPEAAAWSAEMRFDDPQAGSDVQPWGQEDHWWWSVGGGLAHDFEDAEDVNLYAAFRYFLVDNVEVAFEGGLWYFYQPGDDAVGFNPNFIVRWHFVNKERWSIYTDVGIGLLFASDRVPSSDDPDDSEGLAFGFTPRAGIGATFKLDEGSGMRLDVGLRWAHVSNARVQGNDDNPPRDSAMLYAGLTFPF